MIVVLIDKIQWLGLSTKTYIVFLINSVWANNITALKGIPF